jgi:hypothetical protein
MPPEEDPTHNIWLLPRVVSVRSPLQMLTPPDGRTSHLRGKNSWTFSLTQSSRYRLVSIEPQEKSSWFGTRTGPAQHILEENSHGCLTHLLFANTYSGGLLFGGDDLPIAAPFPPTAVPAVFSFTSSPNLRVSSFLSPLYITSGPV